MSIAKSLNHLCESNKKKWKSISLNHSNITDQEIRNYYSLKPVKANDEDYDFNKQINKVINEYLKTQTFTTNQAERSFKSRLKKSILKDDGSKVYNSFINWRRAQIQQHKAKVRDIKIQEAKTAEQIDYENIIIQLRTELKQSQNQCEIYKNEIIELKTGHKPVVKEVVKVKAVKEVVKEVVKENIYLKYNSDEERETQYKKNIVSKANELLEQFEHKYQLNKSAIDKLIEEYYIFIENESNNCFEIFEENQYDFDEDELYNEPQSDFENKLKSLLAGDK